MADTLDELAADIQIYVVAPLNAFGLGGFLFDAEGETISRLSADITDHYTEDNKAVQDHIAIRPVRITLKGYVGEVIYAPAGQDESILQTAVQKLTEVNAFLPVISSYATQAQEAIAGSNPGFPTLSDASNVYGLVKNIIGSFGDESRQQNAYVFFKSCMNQGILMGVQTPWEFITNMAIEGISAIQTEESKYITDFTVSMKQIRIAKTKTTAYSTSLSGNISSNSIVDQATAAVTGEAPVLQGDAALQAPNPVQIGNVAGVALPTPTLPGWQSQINGIQDILTNKGAMSILGRAVGAP